MLNGEISLYSVVNIGSTFNVYLPLDVEQLDLQPQPPKYVPEVIDVTPPKRTRGTSLALNSAGELTDDRDSIKPEDRVFLIIEDDVKFNQILLELLRKKGIKVIISTTGNNALELARKYQPTAITVDLRLQDTDGSLVIEHLKNDISIRHIPICVITVEEDEVKLLQRGVYDYVCKPVNNEELEKAMDKLNAFAERTSHSLLVAIHDEERRQQALEYIENTDIKVIVSDTGRKALNQLRTKDFDCILTDMDLPDMSCVHFVREMQKNAKNRLKPVIIYRSKKLSSEEEADLEELLKTAVVKEVKSPVGMMDETTLFLHRKAENLPERQRETLVKIHQSDEMIEYKKVLVVDDDIRNIFLL